MTDHEHTPNPGPTLWIRGGVLVGIGAASFWVMDEWDVAVRVLFGGLALLAAGMLSVGAVQLWRARR